jgi:hypothetical protein
MNGDRAQAARAQGLIERSLAGRKARVSGGAAGMGRRPR